MTTLSQIDTLRYSGDFRVDSLITTAFAWNYTEPQKSVINYTFDVSRDINVTLLNTPGAFTASQQAATFAALAYVTSITGVQFILTDASSADIHFLNGDVPWPLTMAQASSEVALASDASGQLTLYKINAYLTMDNGAYADTSYDLSFGSQGYQNLLHELGHMMGLGHPFEADTPLSRELDTTMNTIMSYTNSGFYKSTFEAYDLLALQWIWGGDGLRGAYGFNSANGSTNTSVVGQNYVLGTPANDTLTGGLRNDLIMGGAGNDTINGGAGLDTAVYNEPRQYCTVSANAGRVTITDTTGWDGSDTLTNVERIRFTDSGLAFDVAGNAGQAYRLYQAAFARTPDRDGVSFWIAQVDHGMSLHDAAQAFIGSAEFRSIYGVNPSNTTLATAFYTNVLGRAPDAQGLAFWVNVLQSGTSAADVLASFSESSENIAHVAPAVANGIEYSLYYLA